MIGRTLKNRYQLLEILAQGAGSTTYRAHDTTLNRDVSLKMLPTLNSAARDRFFQQARRAAQLSHPNIAAVYEVDTTEDGTPFVVSEYVEGKPLSSLAPAPPLEVVKLGQQIAAALDYAHQQGVIHADLNPTNVRVTPDGQAKILDVGLRLAETASSTVTATGALIGNPAYLSPEQVQGVKVDVRSDIYALGIVLYELATGEPPFKGDTPMAVLIQQVKQSPAPPSTLAPAVPSDLEAAILKALEKDPTQRYQSSDALESALKEIAARRELKSAPPPSDDDFMLDELEQAPSQHQSAVPPIEQKEEMFGGVPPAPPKMSDVAPPPSPQPIAAAPEPAPLKAEEPPVPPPSIPRPAPLPMQPQPAMPAPAAEKNTSEITAAPPSAPPVSAGPPPADEKARSETSLSQPATPEHEPRGAGEGALPLSPPQAAPPQPPAPEPSSDMPDWLAEPPPAQAAPQPGASSGGSLLGRIERRSSEPGDGREFARRRAIPSAPTVDIYADLKSRIQSKLRAELNSLQIESPEEKRSKVQELFNTLLAEENMVLSRAERQGFFETIVADVLGVPADIHFSAHYPKEVKPDDWQPLHAYLYKQSSEKAVAEDANKQLGERAPLFRKLFQAAKQVIQEGELVTATPMMTGFQFNPPSISVSFFEDWHRFDFKLRAHTAPLNQSANGLLTFSVAGVIVADIPLSIFVGESTAANEQTSAAAKPYQAIFCSYSHDDTQIVERVERAYKALGLDYLRDVMSLKSGTHWSEELLQLIEKADIFQLFWSDAAATSPYVQQEWEYALKLNRDQAHFIRPVYWRQPMPPPPHPMTHIHFAYQPDLEK